VNPRTGFRRNGQTGFSLLELVVVLAISLVIAGITVPGMVQTWYNLQLRASAGEVADLMQRARMQAARGNYVVAVRYRVVGGAQQVYTDFNNAGAFNPNNGETLLSLARITAAPNAPGGNPANYVDTMDTSAGAPCDNTCTLAFSPRGLPCNLVGGACPTPSPSYFVYYFNDGRPNGWAAVLVSKAGRTRVLMWNGTSWK
jgi:prepilin-type N-terminal cleavage/methylation domain-containing protein